MESFLPVAPSTVPWKDGYAAALNSQECFLQPGLGFDWFGTKEDRLCDSNHTLPPIHPCLSPLLCPGNLYSSYHNERHLFVHVCLYIR